MKMLTDKQKNVYEFIKQQVGQVGFPPSVREIAQAFSISTRAAYDHLRAIEKKGYIRRDPMKPRAIQIIGFRGPDLRNSDEVAMIPLVGRVAAGQPILAEENIEDYMPFPASMVQKGNVFALKVNGDSMIEDGILDGDYVLVREQNVAERGETVVALLGDEATVKRFYPEKNQVRLAPANAVMQPIITNDVSIAGKVVGVFRRLN
ncbi:MAG: transcriptional repressor LexA [Candidatus Latescibacteria bacterium]|nr:transcriptional repressor LexA [Candidatus Latescibacterota bacterium]